jgi:molecular chaperone DnaK
MRALASQALGSEVTKAVVTVPAHFNDNQRQATKDACKIAGLETLRIINEPTAAALAYGFGKSLNETIAIYDLGGGTFDISILRLKDNVFEVVSTAGDTYLGGNDFDERIVDLSAEHFHKKTGVDLRKIPQAIPLLRVNAEKAKQKLSYSEKTDIYVPGIIQQNGKPIDLHFALTRERLREATNDLIQKTFSVCDEALNKARVKPSELTQVILVGGSTKMPLIFQAVSSYFGRDPLNHFNPDEVVSIGASIQAHSLSEKKSERRALLLDVTPLDLGIKTVGGYIETIIDSNCPIPTQATRTFTTTKDDQEAVDISIYQGKNRRIEESSLLGEFEFSGFRKAKAGEVSISVNFSINADGIVEVNATDPDTGVTQTMKVKLASTMPDKKIIDTVKKTKDYKEVKLKDEWMEASKVTLCIPSKGLHDFEEGYIRKLDVDSNSFTLYQGNELKSIAKSISRAEVAWFLEVEDFANISRYISTMTSTPETPKDGSKLSVDHFVLTDGSSVFGNIADDGEKEAGVWIEPYFEHDSLPGKLFLYKSFIKEQKEYNAG